MQRLGRGADAHVAHDRAALLRHAELVEHGRAGTDPAFYFREFAAPDDCATDDRKAWRVANPALACKPAFLSEDGIEAARRTIREPVFRQLRLGQWVTGVDSWLPWGTWEACATDRRPAAGERVVLAFDGSGIARVTATQANGGTATYRLDIATGNLVQ